MIPFLSVVSPMKDRLIERISRQKSKRERNIQAFVRSEAHQITRKGYEGWRFLFITFLFNKFKILLSLLLAVHRKNPSLIPRALFWFHGFGKKNQEALKGSLGRGVPPKPSSPDTLFKTEIVGSTKIDHPSPTLHSFFRHPVQDVHPENRLLKLCHYSASRGCIFAVQATFPFRTPAHGTKKEHGSQGSGARAGAQPFRPHKEVPTTVSPALWRGRSRGGRTGAETGANRDRMISFRTSPLPVK